MQWLRTSGWHYAVRLPCDVLVHGASRYPTLVGSLYPPVGEARLDRNVGLWADGEHRCNLVLATVQGAKDSWAVITDEIPTLQTLWQYEKALSRGGVVNGRASQVPLSWRNPGKRSPAALERLYLIAAIAILYATTQGMAVQLAFFAPTGRPALAKGN